MKKSLKVIMGLCAIILVLGGCNNQKENKTNVNNVNSNINVDSNTNADSNTNIIVESEPINTNYNNAVIFDSIKEISKLDESTKLTEQQIQEEFEFNEYATLEKEIRSNISEGAINEVGIIKLGDISQSEKVMEIVLKRKEALTTKYADNPEIAEILNNSDNFILKQEAGVVKYIISDDVASIEKNMAK